MGIERAVEELRSALASYPSEWYQIAKDWAPTWAEEESDYFVAWEIRVEPADARACPFDVWFVEGGESRLCCAFGFDSVALLADRLDLKPIARRTGFLSGGLDFEYAFGFEPIWLRPEQLHLIVGAVFEGQLEVKYWELFGCLLSWNGGLTIDVGVPLLQPGRRGRSFRYAPYAGAPAPA